MNPDVKQKWVAALRSGEYKQGRKRLRHAGRYCCLGVLCEIAVTEGVASRRGGYYISQGDRDDVALPEGVMTWAGLASATPTVGDVGLDTYNDGSRNFQINPRSFGEIADMIEASL